MKMLPAEALVAGTINAAWSLGLGGMRLVRLEAGKAADFLIHECERLSRTGVLRGCTGEA